MFGALVQTIDTPGQAISYGPTPAFNYGPLVISPISGVISIPAGGGGVYQINAHIILTPGPGAPFAGPIDVVLQNNTTTLVSESVFLQPNGEYESILATLAELDPGDDIQVAIFGFPPGVTFLTFVAPGQAPALSLARIFPTP